MRSRHRRGNSQPSNTQTITFVADKATATVSGIEVMGNYALADGKAKQTYKVTVTDANNNLVKDSEVTLTASPASLNLEPNGTATTNEQGAGYFHRYHYCCGDIHTQGASESDQRSGINENCRI